MVRTAARLSASASWSHRLASVLAKPCTTVMGVRSSWLVVARNRSFASSSSLAAVTSRKSITSSPRSASEVHRTSSQRPFGSLWVSIEPGSGSGNDGGLPMASWAGVPVIRCAAGFHCRTRPAASSTAMPSALPSMTARSMRPLPDHLLERHRVGQGHPGVAGQQLEQLQLDVAELAPAVQRVQRPVGLARHVREAERDRVQAGQRRPDQVVEAARLAGRHHDRLTRVHQLADQAVG